MALCRGRGCRLGGGCLCEKHLGGLFRELLHLVQDGVEPLAIGDPFLVEAGLVFGESSGLAGDFGAPLPVGSMQLGRVGTASAAGVATGHEAVYETAFGDEADVAELAGEVSVVDLERGQFLG